VRAADGPPVSHRGPWIVMSRPRCRMQARAASPTRTGLLYNLPRPVPLAAAVVGGGTRRPGSFLPVPSASLLSVCSARHHCAFSASSPPPPPPPSAARPKSSHRSSSPSRPLSSEHSCSNSASQPPVRRYTAVSGLAAPVVLLPSGSGAAALHQLTATSGCSSSSSLSSSHITHPHVELSRQSPGFRLAAAAIASRTGWEVVTCPPLLPSHSRLLRSCSLQSDSFRTPQPCPAACRRTTALAGELWSRCGSRFANNWAVWCCWRP